MKLHKFIKLTALAAIFLLLVSIVNALGLSPAKKVVYFEPNKKETVAFRLINNEAKDAQVSIDITGELAEYITVPEKIVAISKNEEYKEFSLNLDLPDKFQRFGLIESAIKATELVSDENAAGISTLPSIKGKLQLRIPYPKKYIESKLDISESDFNVRFVMPVFNYGSEDIKNAKAVVSVFDSGNNLIKELETGSVALDVASQSKLETSWKADNKGAYYAKAGLTYDGEVQELGEYFIIGVPFINITKIIVKNFKLGGIAKFDIYMESDWNTELKETHADAIIYKEDRIYMQSATDQISLLPKKETLTYLFWDTKEIQAGEYGLNLTIISEFGKNEHFVKLTVDKDSLMTSLTPEEIKTKSWLSVLLVLAIIIIILILSNIAWLIYFKKFKKNKN